MIEVKIPNKTVDAVMTIVRELRAQGLVQGIDFDFAYHQSKWDNMIGNNPTYSIFTFYEDKTALLFILKYSK